MNEIAYAVLLVVVGLVMLVAEIFISSFGVLIIAALGCFACAVYFAFEVSTSTGYIFAFSVLIGTPIVGFILLKVFPRTRAGKRMILAPEERPIPASHESADLSKLVGKRGTAASMLRPAGVAMIDGGRVDVVTDGRLIEIGTPIEVVEVEGGRVVVRAVEQESKEKSV
jgi:membrane-bound serine protease (ClpP class)